MQQRHSVQHPVTIALRGPRSCLTALLLLLSTSAHAELQTYRFDPLHTQVIVFVQHLGFSSAVARLRVQQGWFQFDPADWSSARTDLEIDLASLDLGDSKWNDSVKSAQFLDLQRWPQARFSSQRVEKTGADSGILHGELTLRGVSRPLDIAFRLNRIGMDPYRFAQKAGFSGSAHFLRSDFGMRRFAEVVGDNLELRIEVEGLRSDAAGPASSTPTTVSGHATEKH